MAPTTTQNSDADGDDDDRSSGLIATATATRTILEHIVGEDPGRDGLVETPLRFAQAMSFLTSGYEMSPEQVVNGAIFEDAHEEMVVVRDMDIYSLCEHHLIPFFGKAHVCYVPDPAVGVIGLSKLARLVQVYARRLQVQERLTREIMQAIVEQVRARGVGVVLECRHLCMEMRGVQQASASTVTTSTCGVLEKDPMMRSNFWNVVFGGSSTSAVSHPTAGVREESGCLSNTEGAETVVPPAVAAVRSSGNAVSSSSLSTSSCSYKDRSMADVYRLYTTCAADEFSKMAQLVQEAVMGPLSRNKHGMSMLDIGAGNGCFLRVLHSKIHLSRYAAFENDTDLCQELQKTASELGLSPEAVLPETFAPGTTNIEETFDVVLLSHSLYGAPSKLDIVQHALNFVTPGGVLLLFHRWEAGGTLDRLSQHLSSQSMLHHVDIVDAELNLAHLDSEGKSSLDKYTKGVITEKEKRAKVVRAIGCIAVEPHSCQLGNSHREEQALNEARQQVCYGARHKVPAAFVVPNTIVGIQACLRAASLRTVGSGQVSVIGGGHSSNCIAQDAIAINMRLWDHVEVNRSDSTVRVGGGATIGDVTKACEKQGLTAVLGDRPGVGMGLILQGGINHLMRQNGLACDNVIRVIYLSPSGKLKVADTEETLFPFRGAGPNFGIVLEVTLKAKELQSIIAKDTQYILRDKAGLGVLTRYSNEALACPGTSSLDGYIFWSSHDSMAFATSRFDLEGGAGDERSEIDNMLPVTMAEVIQSEPMACSPSDLFDRELYMTGAFDPKNVLKPGVSPPIKLRSSKRCILLPPFHSDIESKLFQATRVAPTKWCYIHLLHGGGAVSRVPPGSTAFGCRNWTFAAVITARWADGDREQQAAVDGWLEKTMESLLAYSNGVYASDLEPCDVSLAPRSFGPNCLRLANMKRLEDPLNILGCGCPLLGGEQSALLNDPRLQDRGVVVIFCGRRFAGKDWLAHNVARILRSLLGDTNGNFVSVAQISNSTKISYASINPSVDADKLLHSRLYKEEHRKALGDYYQQKKAQDIAYDAKCFVEVNQQSTASILLLTGMRDGLEYARTLAGRPVVLIRVDATEASKQSRGWSYDPEIDGSTGECSADLRGSDFWDLIYQNDSLTSSFDTVQEWTKRFLAPEILKRSVRQLPQTPQPGIVYKDLVGSLFLQPFGMSLCTALMMDRLQGQHSDSFDAIVAPEALGFLFASPLAMLLHKPLILVRKGGKLPGHVTSVGHNGSNMSNLMDRSSTRSSTLEIIAGAVVPGQRLLAVDDCLASGATMQALAHLVANQAGMITQFLFIMELPDLSGRTALAEFSGKVFSLMQFAGR